MIKDYYPQLEEEVIETPVYQRFIGIGMDREIPDFTTVWHFKEKLMAHDLMDKLFDIVYNLLDNKGLILKRGTIVDATIITSVHKPLKKEKRSELEQTPNSQMDTDAHSVKKGSKWYFGYRGHIGVDWGSKLIRKRSFTPANESERGEFEQLISGDERCIFGDKGYPLTELKQACRAKGIYYGILDKAVKGSKLSKRQEKRNKQKSRVRSGVEHVFAQLKCGMNYVKARANTLIRNRLRFDFNCIVYNVLRGLYLLKVAK